MIETNHPVDSKKLYFGASYYPEHWPEACRSEEIRRMVEAGLSVVRMGEFAWSTMEPSEGCFELDWLERTIEQLAEAGIETVLGTPTAAPPAWLVEKYPGVLAITELGRQVQFGNRCHYCVNSGEFHAAAQRIVLAMAQRFGSNPQVIGWQFDNEFRRVCYCDRCRELFQKYLQKQYGTLQDLNAHWTTAYWSQTYSAWEQIPIPIGRHNPGLRLAFKRFVTESYRAFQKLQIEALQPYLHPDAWMTHNFMFWNDGFDHYEMSADLDMAAWDWYVGTGHQDYLTSGASHDLVRGFKSRNFWLIETQPGSVNWKPVNNALYRGEARAMAYHAVAHGADALLYWQWRSALGGQEQYHGTLLDQSGQPRPFFEEAQQIGREFAQLSGILVGTTVRSQVAMLNDYESRWSIQWQPHHQDFDYVAFFNHYYVPLAQKNVAVDILGARGLKHANQLAGYRLVIAPALLIMTDELAEVLLKYVELGGHLVLTIRTGMKDEHNALLPRRQPGPLAEAAGVEVEEFFALDEPVPVSGKVLQGTSTIWAERLKPLDARATSVMATYGASNGWLDDQPAITVKSYRNGLIYYVGVYLDDAAQRVLMNRIMKLARVVTINTPPGVEMRSRINDKQEFFILINHTRQDQLMQMPWGAHEYLTGLDTPGEWKLPPYGVAVFSILREE